MHIISIYAHAISGMSLACKLSNVRSSAALRCRTSVNVLLCQLIHEAVRSQTQGDFDQYVLIAMIIYSYDLSNKKAQWPPSPVSDTSGPGDGQEKMGVHTWKLRRSWRLCATSGARTPKMNMLSSPISSAISTLAPSMVPMMREPFIANFMLPVPEASVPAVLMCWLTSEPGHNTDQIVSGFLFWHSSRQAISDRVLSRSHRTTRSSSNPAQMLLELVRDDDIGSDVLQSTLQLLCPDQCPSSSLPCFTRKDRPLTPNDVLMTHLARHL